MQAKIEHTLGWAARHRMPVEVVRLEDVQPPSEQLVLVRRLAAKYDLPLAHAHADAGGASDAAAIKSAGDSGSSTSSTSSLAAEGALNVRDTVARHRGGWATGAATVLGRSLQRVLRLAAPAEARSSDHALPRAAAEGGNDQQLLPMVHDAREWEPGPFDARLRQSK